LRDFEIGNPAGQKKREKIFDPAFTKKVKGEIFKILTNTSKIQIKIIFSFFEVHNLDCSHSLLSLTTIHTGYIQETQETGAWRR